MNTDSINVKQVAGRLIKLRRQQLGMSQEQLGLSLGSSRNSKVSNWERGIDLPPAYQIPKLCELLEITPNDLYGIARSSAVTTSDLVNTFIDLEVLLTQSDKLLYQGVPIPKHTQETAFKLLDTYFAADGVSKKNIPIRG